VTLPLYVCGAAEVELDVPFALDSCKIHSLRASWTYFPNRTRTILELQRYKKNYQVVDILKLQL
jgi:hypothetical protein